MNGELTGFMPKQSTLVSFPSQEGACALVVSDCEADQLALRWILESRCRLEQARNCCEALQCLRRNRVAVVICGSKLPDGDWKAVLDALNGTPAAPKLIVVSQAPDDDAFWAEVLNLGGWDVLAKPFVPEEVVWATRSAWLNWRSKWQARPPAQARQDRTRSAAAAGPIGGSAA